MHYGYHYTASFQLVNKTNMRISAQSLFPELSYAFLSELRH